MLRALSDSERYEFRFWGSHQPVEGIEPFGGDEAVIVNPLRISQRKRGFSVHGIITGILHDRPKVVILLGNPNIPQTWLAAIVSRLLGIKVLFWSHGWLKREPRLKAAIRNVYFSLADAVLVYGDRAKRLAAVTGFQPDKVFPIYNSLDWRKSSNIYAEIRKMCANDPQKMRGSNYVPLLICTARLTRLCRFDLLLDAMALMKKDGLESQLYLVGDGPERAALESQATRLRLDVRFLGAIYEEEVLARLIYHADVTVSPGKVGLTAIHSLSYGTPVVTHSDLSEQMPEVESIIEGQTGAFFIKNDVGDLARAIQTIIQSEKPREETREICRTMVRGRYTPEIQRELIEAAIDSVLSDERES